MTQPHHPSRIDAATFRMTAWRTPLPRYTTSTWATLGEQLAHGYPVIVHHTVYQHLAATATHWSESRAGTIIVFDQLLVRLTTDDGPPTLQRHPYPVTPDDPEHEHQIACHTIDGWDVLSCTTCGQEW